MKRLIPVLLTLLLAATTTAREQYIYTVISHGNGFTSTVNCIYKEKYGDVWLGTPNGLYRFNGTVLHQLEGETLESCAILNITEDKAGNLWVLTDRRLLRRRPGEDRFHIIDDTAEGRLFHSFCQDDEGVWFGGAGTLYRYTFGNDSFKEFCSVEGQDNYIIKFIDVFDEQTLICCSHHGVSLVDRRSGKAEEVRYGKHREVSAMLTDSNSRLWLAFYNNGIHVFEKDGTPVKTYTTSNSALSNNVVLCLTENEGKIWAGTDGGGLNIITPEEDRVRVLSHVAGDPSSFPAHSIKSIHSDEFGNIWAGSVRDGVIRVSQSGMKTFADSHLGLKTGLSNPTVLCFFQDSNPDHIWVGTDGEGINLFDQHKREFTHYPSTFKSKIVSIASYSETELAISSYSDRIWLFNRQTGKTRELFIDDEDLTYSMRYGGRSINLANGKDGSLYLFSNTIRMLDKSSGRCLTIRSEDGSKADGNYLFIGRTEEGLWFHDGKSVYMLSEEDKTLYRKSSLDGHILRSGYIGRDKTMWLAGEKGLYSLDMGSWNYNLIKTDIFQGASCVVCDRHSRVWVGTDKGLYAYLPEFSCFTIFGQSDGAARNEYLSKAKLVSTTGNVFMGGVLGMLEIDSDYTIETTEVPVLKLYAFSIDDEIRGGEHADCHEVPRDCKTLSISVSTHEKDIFRQKRYKFTFPKENRSIESSSPTLVLRQLPKPGVHDVLVSCTRRNGDWSIPTKILTIKVPLPWYLSWWFISLVLLGAGTVFGIVFISIRRRQKEQAQLAAKEQARQLYEEKVRMLINISHELRTPLTLIISPLKRILKSMDKDHEHFSSLSRIHRQARRMTDTINMVLDLRKLEVGGRQLKLEKLDFNKWILETADDIINEERDEGIQIVTDLDPGISSVDFDKRKCDAVLTNILINAVKHSSPGKSITVRTKLTDDMMARVYVIDQGPGLGDLDPDKMFTRFYQSNSEQYGSGIGLSYSKILVELHGGCIGAYDNFDQGATFWWEIPVHNCVENTEIPEKPYLNEILGHDPVESVPIPENDNFSTAGMTLMLVDDNLDLLAFLREALNSEFNEILTASSGRKALAMLAKGQVPDMIVSDVNMPDGDGYTLCKELKASERYNHIPVVLLTARGEEQSQSDSYRMGAEAYMAKPFEVETLFELIRNILRRKADIRKKYLDTNKEDAAQFSSKDEDFILRLNRLIVEHISDPELDQQLICRELGVSRALLYNRMKAITGGGAKEYITRIRLEKAKSLIESTDLTIAEISEMTGFSTQSYFSTAFKSYTGKTPSQYKIAAKR